MGVRPAEVTAVIKSQAEEDSITRAERGELPPIESCLINTDAVGRLLGRKQERKWSWKTEEELDDDGDSGFAQIVVTRLERNRYLFCTYLVDYWCLGGNAEKIVATLRKTVGEDNFEFMVALGDDLGW